MNSPFLVTALATTSLGAAFIIPLPSPYRLPQKPSAMSHCGPCTTNFFSSTTLLRICTPLLPLPSLSRTSKTISKSLYFFLLMRKVLDLMPLGPVLPTMAPSCTDHSSVLPSQPSRFLRLKKVSWPSPAVAAAHHSAPTTATMPIRFRML